MKSRYVLTLLVAYFLGVIPIAQAQEIKLLRNLSSLLGNSNYRLMESVEMGGKLYFTTWSQRGTELWYTDGNVTAVVYEWPLGYLGSDYACNKLYVCNNKLLFTGIDSAHGKELWTSDGTTAGTYLLKDINVGSGSAFLPFGTLSIYNGSSLRYSPFSEMNGKFYFIATNSSFHNHLWETDGTAGGTRDIKLFDFNAGWGFGPHIGIHNGRFFLDTDFALNDFATYISDGTQSGTTLLKQSLLLQDYFSFNGRLFYNQNGNRGFGVSNGTATGTFFIDSTIACSADKVILNNRLYFFNNRDRRQLYTSDGTVAGTWKIRDSLQLPNRLEKFLFQTDFGHYPVVFQNNIYFCGANELWKSDGTYNGTEVVKDIPILSPFTLRGAPSGLAIAGNNLYFKAWTSVRMELYVSDGTSAGTHQIVNPNADYRNITYEQGASYGPDYPNEDMMVYKGRLYFTAIYDTAIGKALYQINLPLNAPGMPAAQNALDISPNPSTGAINIRYPEGAYVNAEVYDAIGRSVYKKAVSTTGHDVLNLSGLPSGTYFTRLSGKTSSLSAPIVIER